MPLTCMQNDVYACMNLEVLKCMSWWHLIPVKDYLAGIGEPWDRALECYFYISYCWLWSTTTFSLVPTGQNAMHLFGISTIHSLYWTVNWPFSYSIHLELWWCDLDLIQLDLIASFAFTQTCIFVYVITVMLYYPYVWLFCFHGTCSDL